MSYKIDYTTIKSGSERVVGYLATDNKPIYEQEFHGTGSIPSGGTSYSATLIASGVDKLLSADGYIERSGTQFPLTYINTTTFTSMPIYVNEMARCIKTSGGSIQFQALSTSQYNLSYTVIVRYTKS